MKWWNVCVQYMSTSLIGLYHVEVPGGHSPLYCMFRSVGGLAGRTSDSTYTFMVRLCCFQTSSLRMLLLLTFLLLSLSLIFHWMWAQQCTCMIMLMLLVCRRWCSKVLELSEMTRMTRMSEMVTQGKTVLWVYCLSSCSFLIVFFSYKVIKMLSVCVYLCVCLDVNQIGTNCNCCTQRLVILHTQTY